MSKSRTRPTSRHPGARSLARFCGDAGEETEWHPPGCRAFRRIASKVPTRMNGGDPAGSSGSRAHRRVATPGRGPSRGRFRDTRTPRYSAYPVESAQDSRFRMNAGGTPAFRRLDRAIVDTGCSATSCCARSTTPSALNRGAADQDSPKLIAVLRASSRSSCQCWFGTTRFRVSLPPFAATT
jgi:hypothetical protein